MKNEWGDVRLGIDAYDLSGKKALVIGAGAPAGADVAGGQPGPGRASERPDESGTYRRRVSERWRWPRRMG
mgnify:CR=1 FL=1